LQIADPVDSIDLVAIALLLKSNHLILDTRRSLLVSGGGGGLSFSTLVDSHCELKRVFLDTMFQRRVCLDIFFFKEVCMFRYFVTEEYV
jgi:hypothetical protein